MTSGLGPRALRVYEALHHAIRSGELPPGAQLPTIPLLAADFGVSPVTIRNVQARLEEEGLISREVGRGTFVLSPAPRSVLILDDDKASRDLIAEHVVSAGYRPLLAGGPAEAMVLLDREKRVALVLSDTRIPDQQHGIDFIRSVRQRWPSLPLAAVTAYPDDLAELHGTADCPTLVVMKPVRQSQIHETLSRLPAGASQADQRLPVLVVDDDTELRWLVTQMISVQGHEVEEAATGSEALMALGRRHFSHVLLDLHMPGGGMETAAAIAKAHQDTVVVLMTAYPEEVLKTHGGPWLLLSKPFQGADVEQILTLRRTPLPGSATA